VVAKRRDGLSPATVNRCLNVLSLVLNAALRRGLVRVNVVSLVERPREPRRRWRILSPVETRTIEAAFVGLIAEAESDRDRDDLTVTRRLFLVHMGTGMRRGEAAGLRWRSVFLADPSGPVLRVEETFVRNRVETPKSDAGRRTISLGEKLAAELFEQRGWSPYRAEDDYVFANPRTGRPFDEGRYAELVRLALARAGIEERIRPSHELRHSSITNAAAAGTSPEALMSRAGHSSYATTRRYIDLAGERFRAEADRLEDRLWGESGRKNRYNPAPAVCLSWQRTRPQPRMFPSGGGGIRTPGAFRPCGFQDRPVRPLRHPAERPSLGGPLVSRRPGLWQRPPSDHSSRRAGARLSGQAPAVSGVLPSRVVDGRDLLARVE
jgi:integrase